MKQYNPHNEDTRVKIPALVHFTRLGYEYLSMKQMNTQDKDEDTNIVIPTLRDAINRINQTELSIQDTINLVDDIKVALNADDLGRAFYELLISGMNGLKLIDLTNEPLNTYQVATELTYKNGSDEFRPDITVLINGIPVAFVEVKKPNNKDGILAERDRMNMRGKNKRFRRFINMMQIMVFSNNREYDDNEVVPLEGAFYATTAYEKLFFSHFREEDETIYQLVKEIDEQKEVEILKDNNYATIKSTEEYKINLNSKSPTNRIITSLFAKERLNTWIKYAIVYVDRTTDEGITVTEKHIMRYPQFFATKAIEQKLNSGVKNGIIWHTQGSGKTALTYYNVKYLKDYYQKQGVIAQFYFIVDRLDLATQAAEEFRGRGLHVTEVKDKKEFADTLSTIGGTHNTGVVSITVVNIQKFQKDKTVKSADYNVNVQRVYFLDEAHRSYNPKGSFLGNLLNSDRNAVKIALTGTPLIGVVYDEEGIPISGKPYDSKAIFGDYIHKYYYNRSIADGYTLKLIREGIATTYKKRMESALDKIELEKGTLAKDELYAHAKYVKELVAYITEDYAKSKITMNDDTIGGMIVCDSSKQAKEVYKQMQDYPVTSALILHDVDDKEIRKEKRNDFKKGKIDFLIVYNMLLTGFDAPRLKKLYLGRKIKDHSLLQALTRVNRPYVKHRYGYVVDFADIRAEFDKANQAYFKELQEELGDAFQQYNGIFKTQEEIERDLKEIKSKLFLFDTNNREIFSQQISDIGSKEELLEVKKALVLYKELYNVAELFEYGELIEQFNLEYIASLYTEVVNRINLLNKKDLLANAENMSAILTLAIDEIEFNFQKVMEHELVIADGFRESLNKTRMEMERNVDRRDPEYILLLEELERLLKKKNIEELTADEMKENMLELERIQKEAHKKNQLDRMLAYKYFGDEKFMRTHKRMMEEGIFLGEELDIFNVLLGLKEDVDNRVLSNEQILDNEPYFRSVIFPFIKQEITGNQLTPTMNDIKFIGETISNEYIAERNYTVS